jgi:hypothetical protein
MSKSTFSPGLNAIIIANFSTCGGPLPVELPIEPDESFETHFERRTKLHGLPV